MVKWIKIVVDVFDDEKIKLIDKLPARDEILVIWFKILCLAGKSNRDGLLFLNDKIAYTPEMLSAIFNRELESVKLALAVFEKYEMIEILENVILISNWEKHQNIKGLQKIREQTRKRVAKYRENQRKLECNANVTQKVTLRNVLEEDIEEELELDKEKNKDKESFFGDLLNEIDDLSYKEALNDFINHRNDLKKPLTERAFKMILKKLEAVSVDLRIKAIDEAIINNWQSVFPKEAKEIKNPDWYDKYQKELDEAEKVKKNQLTEEEIKLIMEETECELK